MNILQKRIIKYLLNQINSKTFNSFINKCLILRKTLKINQILNQTQTIQRIIKNNQSYLLLSKRKWLSQKLLKEDKSN